MANSSTLQANSSTLQDAGMSPAINLVGTRTWYKNGELHRTDGPAIIYANGDKFWFQNGELHRTDGAAIEYADGDKYWYQNGDRHRTNGPAIEWQNGSKFWLLNGDTLTQAEFAAKVLDKETALLWKMSGYCWPFDFS
jgi:hypothetical protein